VIIHGVCGVVSAGQAVLMGTITPSRGFGWGFLHWGGIAFIAAAAVANLVLAMLAHRQYRRARDGHCLGCGYDLRMTPRRCPECGRQST
jgi:hypothetical protein